ncbi:MAG: sigma-70 family RNA polymerase sigma factor [Bacteroidia bacterium]
MDEVELIRNCIHHKKEAQQILFERYFGKMMGVCLRYSKDIPQAQEILNDGFFSAFQTLKKYNSEMCFENWLKEIMISAAVKNLRNNRKEYLIASTVNAGDVKKNNDVLSEAKLETMDTETILHALQQLPPAYRVLYNLAVIDDISLKNIMENLDMSEETAIANISKAKFYLQKNLNAFV